jgi:hypothetical protein
MNVARRKKTCIMLQSKYALIFVLTTLCMWHNNALFVPASQLDFSAEKIKLGTNI